MFEFSPIFNWRAFAKFDRTFTLKDIHLDERIHDLLGLGHVYRWVLSTEDGRNKSKFFVGETDDIFRRVREYCAHKSKHHQKIRQVFEDHIKAGGSVTLEVLRFEPFRLCGVEFSAEKLGDPARRRVLESLCLAQLVDEGFVVLNDTLNARTTKRIVAELRRKPEVLVQALKDRGFTRETIEKLIGIKSIGNG